MGKRINLDRVCSIEGCNGIHRARGYCMMHWQRWRFNKDMTLPPKYLSVFKKGWISAGYRVVMTPDGRELQEHRYVMEQHLGRRLGTDEIVHHKNEDKLDNRLCNLEVIARDKHTSIHRAHKMPCLICGKDDNKNGHGLCSFHSQRARQFIKNFGITLPDKIGRGRTAIAMAYMGIALALNNDDVTQRLESLLVEHSERLSNDRAKTK